ncbi:MAG: accessory Sec system translocase SecA2, partial [Pseudonocardiaceae bacterium]|nr:accessory Sec system translocase SecA2 [Pseudonocardiaceae bacterium]
MAAFMRRVKDRFSRFLDRPATVDISRYEGLLTSIEWREKKVGELSDEELTGAATKLRRGGDEPGVRDFTEKELVELCALGREAAKRTLDERPYDVQLLGAMELLAGHVVQMATGEGKTLAGALAAAGYALAGRAVHVMSVNDYLARRDAGWMGPVYELLGVSVGWVDQTSTQEERRAAYAADVTYGSVSEIGFDVLRDRLCTSVDDMVGRKPDVVLVDEADSVLIDEAKVPLVLAGSSDEGQSDPEVAKIVR